MSLVSNDTSSKETKTSTQSYHENQKINGSVRGDTHDEGTFVSFSRGKLFRKKKFVLESDLQLGSTLEKTVRNHYYGGTEAKIKTSKDFQPTWDKHKKKLKESINKRRSNVSNAMKAIFLREYYCYWGVACVV